MMSHNRTLKGVLLNTMTEHLPQQFQTFTCFSSSSIAIYTGKVEEYVSSQLTRFPRFQAVCNKPNLWTCQSCRILCQK